MKSTKIAVALLATAAATAASAAGLPTRDLNPVLQPILIPSLVPMGDSDGWHLEHGLFITNTLQQKSRDNEFLIIDVENYRYEFDLAYRQGPWRAHVNIPLMANDSGELDSAIEDWHDLFGLPQGKRDNFPKDRIDIEYIRDGVVEYRQDSSSSGLGDIALTLGYQPEDSKYTYFAAIELPTGSESDFSGNETFDFALWVETPVEFDFDFELDAYAMAGLSFPGDNGGLEGLLVDAFLVAQFGVEYDFSDSLAGVAQLDFHGETIEDSEMRPFGNSLQLQLGLGFPRLFGNYRLDLFFSEDIVVDTAPDITFGARLALDF